MFPLCGGAMRLFELLALGFAMTAFLAPVDSLAGDHDGDDDDGDDDDGDDDDDGEGPHAKRNYLLIIVDDLGTDKDPNYVSSIPGFAPVYTPALPNIDRVGDNGLRFTRMWAQPACTIARTSLMTGVDPHQSGVGYNVQNFEAGLDLTSFTTVARQFADRGYETALFGKWHVGQLDEAGNLAVPPATS